MKKYLLILAVLFTATIVFAQPGKKPAAKEKVPTQKEMEDMMKEAQKAMDDMSPKDKKMMDSMGIKMPSIKDIPKVTDKQLADAFNDENRVIPSKKTNLIAALPKKVFTASELSAYLKTTNISIAAIIKPGAKQMAEKIMQQFKSDKYYGALIASAANGMWVAGYKEAAVYLMGKATEALPNADNYNNYAAYLTMTGAAHMAIPVLEKLNSIHKKNCTILNNLGQAWLQLGDDDKAEKYLDSTIMIYAYHPQANYTKCLILESKGKTSEAIVALKRSLKHSVTKTKTDKLKKLEKENYKPRGYYVPTVYFSSSFNLGVYIALIPKEYATTVGINIQKKWLQFREQIREEKQRVDIEARAAEKMMEIASERVGKKAIKQQGLILPPYYYKATERFNNYMKGEELRYTQVVESGVTYLKEWSDLKSLFTKELTAEQDRYEMKTPNGANLGPNCAGEMPIITKYITAINAINQKHNEETVKRLVTSSYQMYTHVTATALTDPGALYAVLVLKSNFLSALLDMKHEYYDEIECAKDKEEVYKKGELPDYDEVNCHILNTITFPGLGSIVMRCNNMSMYLNPILSPVGGSLTANFDGYIEQASIAATIKAVEIETGATFDKDGNFVKGNGSIGTTIKGISISANGEVDANGFTKGSVELGIDGELKFIPELLEGEAPVEISLKGELGVGIELTKDGIADFYVKDKVTGDIASNIEVDNSIELTPGTISNTGEVTEPEKLKLPIPKTPSVSVSADNRWSVNSGFSPAQGSLSGLTTK